MFRRSYFIMPMLSDSFHAGEELRLFRAGDAGLMHQLAPAGDLARQELFHCCE